MDRDRLKEVRRTEQTESRINEDFVDWLKTSGLSWLVILMVVLVAYILFVRWTDSRVQHRNNAWIEYASSEASGLPSGFLNVAEQYPNVGSIALLARLQAGRAWLEAVQANRPLDATPGSLETLPPEDRDLYLSRADEAFRSVLAREDASRAKALLMINAMNGRAAAAEARGDIEEAERLYHQAAQRAEADYPHLAKQARKRAETVAAMVHAPQLPSLADLAGLLQPDERDVTPVSVDDALRDLLMPGR